MTEVASTQAVSATPARSGEFTLGWMVLLAGFLGTMCGASPLPFNVLGFLFKPLEAEFGWNVQQVSIGITIFGITASLLAPVFGWLADRHGVRRVAIWSLVGFVITFSSLYFTPPTLAGFYFLWLLVGMIGIGSTPVTSTSPNCSTQAKMPLSSPTILSASASLIAIRESRAILFTVSLSTDMLFLVVGIDTRSLRAASIAPALLQRKSLESGTLKVTFGASKWT